jgi:hypothetical protein
VIIDPIAAAERLSDRALSVAVGAAGAVSAMAVFFSWYDRHRGICFALLAVFLVYFGYRFSRWRNRSPDMRPWLALPLLAFAAPLPELLGSIFQPDGVTMGLKTFAWVMGFALAGHALLEFVTLRKKGGYEDVLKSVLVIWLLATWIGSTGVQWYRFHYFLPSGNPEDTAYLFDCFRSWADGGPLGSEWSGAWLHENLSEHFALHFSPILIPVFAVARIIPSVATLLTLQNIFIGCGLAAWAAVLSRSWRGRTRSGGVPVFLWFLALLVAFPPLNGSLRHELHPVFWSIPVLALVHGAFLTDRRVGFCMAAAAAFLFREDLGMVVAVYAPMALLSGRRAARDVFWWIAPLLGVVGTVVILFFVMPSYGTQGREFFRIAFDTPELGLGAFLVSLLGQPGEVLQRLLRPGHWFLAARLAMTGIGIPARTWEWLPALPYLGLYGLAGADLQLLKLTSHYFVIPAIYLAAGGLFSLWIFAHDLKPHVRDALCVLVWVMCSAQPIRLHLATPERIVNVDRYRNDVLADLEQLSPETPAWVPTRFLVATRPPAAVPMHRWTLEAAFTDETAPRLALLPSGHPEDSVKWAALRRRFRLTGIRSRGRVFDLYELGPVR